MAASVRTRLPSKAATVAVAVGLGVVVAHDGTPGWQAIRLVAVVAATAVVLWVEGRNAVTRSVVELVVGSAAIAAGGAIGVPHLAKTGMSLFTAAGLLTLAGALALFVSGLRGVAPSSSRWVRFPARAGVVVLPLLLVWTLGQAVAATNVPRTELGRRTPADVGLDFRDVAFDATDGVALSGWYVPSRNGASVVLLHGAGSTRSAVLDHAVVLARHGFGVLAFDARGHGRSGGRAMDFGWFGDRDIGGAVAFLERQPDVDAGGIGAVGMSMGGEEAIGASARFPAIRVVVAEGATNRVAGDSAWLSDEFGVRGRISEVVQSVTYGFVDALTTAGPPVSLHDAVRRAARPTLLIAAGDVADEPLAGRYIRSGSPTTVELWVAPGTGHTQALRVHPEEWEARVTAFLETAFGLGQTEQA